MTVSGQLIKSTAALDRQNMNSATRLQAILVDSPVGAILPAITLLNLPNSWLAEARQYCTDLIEIAKLLAGTTINVQARAIAEK